MEIKTLSVESTKEEVAEYFVKNFRLQECNKEKIINEDLSGDTLLKLSELTSGEFIKLLSGKEKINTICHYKFTKFLKENKDKFQPKEIKEVIIATSDPGEIKDFFNKCLNYQKDLSGLNGKDLLELNEQKMIQLGLNLGQRYKLIRYIDHFKTLNNNFNPIKINEINKDSTEKEVAEFLKTKLKFSQESADGFGFDGNSLLSLQVSEIDDFETLKEEERETLKKFLSGELKFEGEQPEDDSKIIITKESNESEVSKFLERKLGLSKEAIEGLDGFEGKDFLSLTDKEINEYTFLSEEEKIKIKEYIKNFNSKSNNNQSDDKINENSSEEDILQFMKEKLNLNEIKDDLFNTIDVEKISNISEKEKKVLNNYITQKKLNSNNIISKDNLDKLESSNETNLNAEATTKVRVPSEFIDFYFVIGISQEEYNNNKLYVQTQGSDKKCEELFKILVTIEGESFYQILYNLKLKKTSKFLIIKIYSEIHRNYFKCYNHNIIFNDEDIYFVFENLKFSSFTYKDYYFRQKEAKPPKLFDQDFTTIFSIYYHYIVSPPKKNYYLINQLFVKAFSHFKSPNTKYTLNFFLQILSLSVLDNNNDINKSLFQTIISMFKINSLTKKILPIDYYNQINIKESFELLLNFYSNKEHEKDESILSKIDEILSLCYLEFSDVESAVKFINNSPHKKDIISNIIDTIDFYNKNIFTKDLLNLILENCDKKEIIKIIYKSQSFSDFIELIYENIELFENISFKLGGIFDNIDNKQSEEIIPKIFSIIKKCKNVEIDGRFIQTRYPNFIEILSIKEREDLYQILKDDNKRIKQLIYEKNYSEVKNNSEIISFIDSFKLWENKSTEDDVVEKLKLLDLEKILPLDLEKLKTIFQNYNFQFNKDKTLGSKVFFLILQKLKNVHDFPNILWYLFDSNLKYRYENHQLNEIYHKYFELFSKNDPKNTRENIFKLLNQTFNFFIKNSSNPHLILEKLMEIMNKEEQGMINEPYLIKLYTDFLSIYHKEINNNLYNHLINYLKIRIIKMDKETLEKILNIKDYTTQILVYFNQYKISRDDFFKKQSENLELFKLIKEIPNNNYIINSSYFTNSLEIIQKIVIDLQTMNFTYQEVLQILELPNDEFNNRIEILQIDTEMKNHLKQLIKEKIQKYEDINRKIDLCKKYLQKMEITDNEDKLFYQKLNIIFEQKNIRNTTIEELEKKLNKDGFSTTLNNVIERAERLSKIEIFKCGKMFIKQANLKLEKEENKFHEILSNINEIKNIFDKETIFQIKEEKLEKFFNLFTSEEELVNELTKLKELFTIDDDDENIIDYLNFNFRREKTKQIVSSYIKTIEILHLGFNKFINIKEIINRLSELNMDEKDFEEENIKNKKLKLNEIISDFESMAQDIEVKIFPLDKISKILQNLWENKLFEFLFHITNNDLRDLNSSLTGTSVDINDINNNLIVKQLIIFFKKEANYFLKDEEDEDNEEEREENRIALYQSDENFFILIKKKIDEFLTEMKISDINEIIKNASNKKNQIDELLKNRNGYEKQREEINMIMKESLFSLFYIDNQVNEEIKGLNKGYHCQVTFSNKEKKKYYNDLIEMQQIASLSQNKNQNNNYLIAFIDIMDKIRDLLNYCTILTSKGYPDYFKFELSIKDMKENYFKNMTGNTVKNKTLDEQNKELKKIIKKMEDLQVNAYNNTRYLKFFSGQQLFLLINYFKNNLKDDDEKIEQIKHLLIYLTGRKNLKLKKDYNCKNYISEDETKEEEEINTSSKKNENFELFKIKKDDLNEDEKDMINIMFNMFLNIENNINKIIDENGLNEEIIFENSKITNKDYDDKKGFYIFENKMIYEQTIKFYHFLVGKNPPRYSILICNEETTLEELLAFLYLSCLCKYHSLFIILKPDRLQISIKIDFQDKIEYFGEKHINSLILILFDDISKSDIGNELGKMKFINKIDEPKINLSIIKEIEVISSSLAGYGKSTCIQNELEKEFMDEAEKNNNKEKFKYICFPLGGEVKRSIIMKRLLKDLKINDENYYFGIHLDLSETEQVELFQDFLFSFLIQKQYTQNENIFCYEGNIRIRIEIPKGFYDFSEKLKILKLFSQKEITNLPDFKILNEFDKHFDDIEDIQKDKELYLLYKDNIEDENKLSQVLESDQIPDDIKELRKKHRYLYQSDTQLVCNYLKLFDSNKDLLKNKNLFFYSHMQIVYELEEHGWYYIAEFIKEDECQKLIKKYLNIDNCSYHQINIFIKVLYHQLYLFSNNHALMAETLYAAVINGEKIDHKIRLNLVESILNLTKFFTIGAFDEILKEQKGTKFDYDENTMKNIAQTLSTDKNIKFENLKDNSLICINEDGESLTILTNSDKNSEEYKNLENLLNMGRSLTGGKKLHLIDFNSAKNDDFNNFPEKIDEEDLKIPNFKFLYVIKKYLCTSKSLKEMKESIGSYTFTADNFFKMILILLRIKSGISVILMGETGCGKTSLVNTICDLCDYELLSKTINAGCTDNDIVAFIAKNNLAEENLNFDENINDDIDFGINSLSASGAQNSHLRNNLDDPNKLKVVFFDELNTCNSQGLITEIMCKHTVQGKKIKKNIAFIGACNPYRKKEKEKIENTGLIKKESRNSNLVYTVNPLTHSQLYYVLNFGILNIEDEKKYVESISEYELAKIIDNKKLLEIIYPFFVNSFIFSQQYIREKNGKESVSLREIRKFFAIYKFIYFDFKRKQQCVLNIDNNLSEDEIKLDYNFYKTMEDEETIHKYSITVAIFICFYVRLNLKEREEFEKQANTIFKTTFIEYSKRLQDEIINNIVFEKGIAPNNVLKLNLFITFIGILTKIAVFLVGPPGCSKTLCLNLLKKSMKGINSKSKFWKLYPQLFVTTYQGSLTSTSKGIKETFDRAKLTLKKWKEKKPNQKEKKEMNGNDIISLVLIDEIGLCEISPYNPLKVLHPELEFDYKKKKDDEKISFVGISNWKLDASKMNRGIYLNVFSPESNVNEMIDTAFEISKIYSNSFILDEKNKNLLTHLVKSVYKYKNRLNSSLDINKNFHGTRDFYYLIKNLVNNIIKKQGTSFDLYDEVFFAIESNYNGLYKNNESSASKAIESEFNKSNIIENKKIFNKFSTIELIKSNIKDNESRYLLLITKSNLSQYLVKQIIKSENDGREIIYYLGSLFEDDIYSEAYSAKAITKIKFYLEEPIILVLKNLSTTYASLYDLFNQRFNYTLGKKYAEISMRDVTNPSLINDSLKIIILIEPKALAHQDPPFINRFQKHIISFDNLLSKKEMEIANTFYEIKNVFQKIEGIKCNPLNQLINFDKEEINGLIFYSKLENNTQAKTYEDYENYILSKLTKTFSQDLIMYLNVYRLNYPIVEKINKYYKKSIHSNLRNYLINVEHSKNIIYTFTSILKSNFKFEIINNKFGKLTDKDVINIIDKNLKSERTLEKLLDDFYSNNQKICLIHFEANYLDNLEFISNYIERIEKDKNSENNNKIFLIIIHLKRSLTEHFPELFLTNLSSYNQSFIDNLDGRDEEIYDFLGKTQKELFFSSLINVENEFLNNIYHIFTTIEYICENKSDNINQHKKNINILLSNNELKKNIIEIVVDKISEQEKIFDSIFRNHNFDDKEFILMIIKELKEKFALYLFKFIVNSEKKGFIYFHSNSHPEISKKIWQDYLSKQDYFSEDISFQVQGNKINVFSSNLPSFRTIKEIRKIIELRKNEYHAEENKIRFFQKPSDLLFDLSDSKKIDENSVEFGQYQKLIDEYFKHPNQNINDYKFANIKDLINLYFVFPKEDLINSLINFLKRNELYILIPKSNLKEGLDLLFEDYCKKYCYDIIGVNLQQYVELIKFMIKLRFSFDKENLESYYIKSVLWLEIYKEEMIYILNITKELLDIEPEIISLIKEKYEKKEIEYIASLHHPLFKKEINYPFLIFLDSISLIILNFILKNDIEYLKSKLNIFANINKKAEIVNLNLRLLSKDFYRFKITYLIIELLNKKNLLSNKKLLDQYINSLFKERQFIKDNDIKNAFDEFNSQYELLFNTFKDTEGFEQLIISLIVSKYKEVNNDNFRAKLCSKIKNNEVLIKFSTELFVLIFRRYRIEPYYLEDNNNEPENPFGPEYKDNEILKEIDGGKNGMTKYLKEILKTIFKFNIIQYFKDEIGNIKDKREIINILLGKNAFNDFRNAYENLKNITLRKFDDIYNYNIKEQYCIAYCNVFLENFVKYCFKEELYSTSIRNDLINFLNDEETQTPLKNSMKIVILKIIKTYYIKDQFTFMFKKNNWSSKYYLEPLIKNYNFISTDNLLHLFYNGKNEELFKAILDEKNSIDKNGGSFSNLNKESFFNILDCMINQNLSNLKSNQNITFFHEYSYSPIIEFAKQIGGNTKDLIDLFFDEKFFNNNMKSLVEKLTSDDFELLLYCYKFSLSSSLANEKSIYSKMIGKNWKLDVFNAYIPGAELFSDLSVESYYYINEFIEDSNKDGLGEGFYICNCGEWYYNPYCGVPVNITSCLNCKKDIGGTDELLTKRGKKNYDKEIIRIYYDEENKRNVEEREDLIERYENEWYDSLLLKEFNEQIESKMKKDYKGLICNN